MVKILLQKQLLEMGAFFYQSGKKGKRRSAGGIIGYGLLMLYCFAAFFALFYLGANALCGPLLELGLGWLYFALMGIMALALGVFGSVFMTYSMLYQGKDNELLLSMPIPPRSILLSRMLSIFIMCFLMEAVVLLPAGIVYLREVGVSLMLFLCGALCLVLLTVLALTLCCILGYLVAQIAVRVRRTNLFTVMFSVVFLFGYFYVYSQASTFLQSILTNAQSLGGKIKAFLFPLYHFGLAAEGRLLSLGILALFSLGLFCLIYYVLSRSFLHLAVTKKSAKREKYTEKEFTAGSVSGALLRKEFSRYLSSSTYIMNCSLGTVLMVVASVAVILKGQELRVVLETMGISDYSALLLAVAACLMSTMNDLTAPSVSLEGKHLWIIKSMPLSLWQVLLAKIKLHLILTLPPLTLLLICAGIVFGVPIPGFLLALLCGFGFTVLYAVFGLAINLKMPNFSWTNETVAVKQGFSVTVTLLGSWGCLMVLAVGFLLLRNVLAPNAYLLTVTIVLWVLALVIYRWLQRRGTAILEAL